MPVEVAELEIPGVKIITPQKFTDDRGFFSEVYTRRDLVEAGILVEFVQDNHSLSVKSSTVRGLHFQAPPFAQDKLVRVARGAVMDVVLDLRQDSATYGKHATATLSADNWSQIFVPVGFAHGFMTLEPNTEVVYKVSNYYSPEHDGGIFWNDEDLNIPWPQTKDVFISAKDKSLRRLKDLPPIFSRRGQL